MAKEPPSQRCDTPGGHFWGNVILIALAHIALIAGLIRWSVAAKASSNPESIVWLGGAGDLSADESEKQESPSVKQPSIKTESSRHEKDDNAHEKPVATTAKSEIELPAATPKPTATATPAKSSSAPASTAKTTPKPIPKATPRKTLVAKASLKPVAKPKPNQSKTTTKSEKKEEIALAKKDSAPQGGNGQSGSTPKAGSESGASSASEFGWYGDMLHDRFYRAWIQPTSSVASGAKISTLARVRIEKDGRVSKFEIIKPSENSVVNESVRLVANQVTQVDPPPAALVKGEHYDVRINFELNTEENRKQTEP
jgi:outer membrane biosynthesis protein TonB